MRPKSYSTPPSPQSQIEQGPVRMPGNTTVAGKVRETLSAAQSSDGGAALGEGEALAVWWRGDRWWMRLQGAVICEICLTIDTADSIGVDDAVDETGAEEAAQCVVADLKTASVVY